MVSSSLVPRRSFMISANGDAMSTVKWQRELFEFKLFGVVSVHGVLE